LLLGDALAGRLLMTRVLVLGSIVAVGCGALLGITLAYQLVPLAVLVVLLGLAGTFAVARATPEPAPALRAPVTLGGPLARPVEEEEDEDEESAAEPVPAPVQQLPVPVVAAVPDAA
jgi:membrane protein implicated in regulation of membrane protease activity